MRPSFSFYEPLAVTTKIKRGNISTLRAVMSSHMPDPGDQKLALDPVLNSVLDDIARVHGDSESIAHQHRANQILAKDRLFSLLESEDRRLICYVTGGQGGGSIDSSDAAPLGSMLDAMGDMDYVDLLIHSPGGYGEVAEKIVEMFRSRARKGFRVIVPNSAKSAATLLALGADAIVMGDASELGPIDPQYEVAIGGVAQMVSGQSFIQAYEDTQAAVKQAMKDGESPVGYLQSLSASTMEPAFIDHCNRGVEFSRDVANRFLRKHQIPAMLDATRTKKSDKQIRAHARRSAENLLSANSRFSHGKLIGPKEAREEVKLHIEQLDHNDSLWAAYWELYVRAEVFMQAGMPQGASPAAKLFFDRNSTLPAY